MERLITVSSQGVKNSISEPGQCHSGDLVRTGHPVFLVCQHKESCPDQEDAHFSVLRVMWV